MFSRTCAKLSIIPKAQLISKIHDCFSLCTLLQARSTLDISVTCFADTYMENGHWTSLL